jgi:rod shape-determining protein MreD|tara:strand:+ start:27077 stop:27583 length:507 start_codon:yes stop_codon:yes gene_type:complete
MNNIVFLNILRFVGLLLLQVLVCSNINFMGYVNPFVYLLFILLYPTSNNRLLFIFSSFLLGLCVDVFLDSGGAHAAATVLIAFLRPLFLKFSFGAAYEYQAIKFSNTDFTKRLFYFLSVVVTHHLLLFSLVVFNQNESLLILNQTLYSTLFSLLLCLLLTSLFSTKQA